MGPLVLSRHTRDKLTPQVAPCWIAVEHYDGLTFALVYIVHLEVSCLKVIWLKWVRSVKVFIFDFDQLNT